MRIAWTRLFSLLLVPASAPTLKIVESTVALARLLPLWRKRFVEAVRTKACYIGGAAARKEFSELRKLEIIDVTPNEGPVVPIGDQRSVAKYGLRLGSIFADKLTLKQAGQGVLLLNEKYLDLAFEDDQEVAVSIIDWYGNLLDLGTAVKATGNPAKVFESVADSAYSVIQVDWKDASALGKLNERIRSRGGYNQRDRVMLLCRTASPRPEARPPTPPARGMIWLCVLCSSTSPPKPAQSPEPDGECPPS